MAEIIFEELPPSRRGGGDGGVEAREIVQALKNNPGQWARIKTYKKEGASNSLASTIKSGAALAWRPRGSFEAAERKVDGEYRVYARYVGEV